MIFGVSEEEFARSGALFRMRTFSHRGSNRCGEQAWSFMVHARIVADDSRSEGRDASARLLLDLQPTSWDREPSWNLSPKTPTSGNSVVQRTDLRSRIA